jgi:hypothetical protein
MIRVSRARAAALAPSLALALAASLALSPAVAPALLEAQVAPGSRLTFTGTADATDLGTPGVALDFVPQVTTQAGGNTGTFASLDRRGGTVGTIADLVVGQGAQVIPGFLVFGDYRFDLAALPPGPFGQSQCYVAPAPGQQCTPYQSELNDPRPTDPLSPFYLTNLASDDASAPIAGALVAFNLVGTVTGPAGGTSEFFGTIATTFDGLSFQEVLGGLEGLGAVGLPYPAITFTGTFVAGRPTFAAGLADVTVTPEPASAALVAGGVAALGLARGRRRRR